MKLFFIIFIFTLLDLSVFRSQSYLQGSANRKWFCHASVQQSISLGCSKGIFMVDSVDLGDVAISEQSLASHGDDCMVNDEQFGHV